MTSYGVWTTMQALKQDIVKLKALDPFKYHEDIKQDEEGLEYFKRKVVVK